MKSKLIGLLIVFVFMAPLLSSFLLPFKVNNPRYIEASHYVHKDVLKELPKTHHQILFWTSFVLACLILPLLIYLTASGNPLIARKAILLIFLVGYLTLIAPFSFFAFFAGENLISTSSVTKLFWGGYVYIVWVIANLGTIICLFVASLKK